MQYGLYINEFNKIVAITKKPNNLSILYESDEEIHLTNNMYFENGQIVTHEPSTIEELVIEQKLQEVYINDLRVKREEECFSVINRGQLWYKTLTDSQIVQLDEWYHLWLDVTDSLVIPSKPDWLK